MTDNYTESASFHKDAPISPPEKPILFSGPMVRAILDGRKTQTRRILKPWKHTPSARGGLIPVDLFELRDQPGITYRTVYKPGTRLWVREKMRVGRETLLYDADDGVVRKGSFAWQDWFYRYGERKIPSIHMPRWASRLLLEVTAVKVERLQDIREKDAKAEGAPFVCAACGNDLDTVDGAEVHWACEDPDNEGASHKEGFRRLWGSINGKGSWDANPWITAITFKRVES